MAPPPTQLLPPQQQPPHQPPAINLLKKPLVRVLIITILCSFSYTVAFYSHNPYSNSTTSTSLLQDPSCFHLKNISTHQNPSQSLHFEPRHALPLPPDPPENHQFFPYCPKNFTNYCPCQDPYRESQFSRAKFFHRERHCPEKAETLRCLVPKPVGYIRPFPWPRSRDYAWFSNVPFPKLTVFKKSQNWVRLEGDRLVFPGGGTSFPKGVKGYVSEINRIVPLKSGNIRTVLDVGCGVSAFTILLLLLLHALSGIGYSFGDCLDLRTVFIF